MLSPDDAELVAREDRIQALAELLDPDRLRERLAAAASPVWGAVGAVRVDYLRYKPGTSLVAGLVADTEAGERRAYAVAGAAHLADKLAKPLARGSGPATSRRGWGTTSCWSRRWGWTAPFALPAGC